MTNWPKEPETISEEVRHNLEQLNKPMSAPKDNIKNQNDQHVEASKRYLENKKPEYQE